MKSVANKSNLGYLPALIQALLVMWNDTSHVQLSALQACMFVDSIECLTVLCQAVKSCALVQWLKHSQSSPDDSPTADCQRSDKLGFITASRSTHKAHDVTESWRVRVFLNKMKTSLCFRKLKLELTQLLKAAAMEENPPLMCGLTSVFHWDIKESWEVLKAEWSVLKHL